MLLRAAAVLAVAAGYSFTQLPEKVDVDRDSVTAETPPGDSDGDGLLDEVEEAGWETPEGAKYRTDPKLADTDGDGLTDSDEAGAPVESSFADAPTAKSTAAPTKNIFEGYADPLVPDTDGDGLGDADEADLSLDPFDRDTDDDLIEDGPEVEVVGTSPGLVDTDGDGFADGYEESHRGDQGLDPQVVDVKVSKMTYATDFAIGSLAGDAWRKDSFAWLAGNLASTGTSSIPVIGWILGPVADLRDAVASAIRGDWVGSGFSAVGAVPYAGDAVAIPGKAAKFVARNPEMAAAVAAAIVAINKVPEKIKIEANEKIWKEWGDLKATGYNDRVLLQLTKGSTNLDALAAAMKRSNHVPGGSARFFDNGLDGEAWLASSLKSSQQQVRVSTSGCVDVCNSTNVRIIDSCFGGAVDTCVGGVAHEAKVGFKALTEDIERQIRSDAHLIAMGNLEGAHWHFFASSHTNKMGASKPLLDRLDEVGIKYTIHPPV